MTCKKSLRQSVLFLVFCIIVAFLALVNRSSAQSDEKVEDYWAFLPVIQTIRPDEWAKRYEYIQDVTSAIRTDDGGYLLTGETGDGNDGKVMKITSDGVGEWDFYAGASGLEVFRDGFQTSNGDYIVTGITNTPWLSAGGFDIWVRKLDHSGWPIWQYTLGGGENEGDYTFGTAESPDGGVVVATRGQSFNSGDLDAWVFKLNANGTVAWQKTIGGGGSDDISAASPTADGGFILAGYSNSGNVAGVWVVRLNGNGGIAWQKIYSAATPCMTRSIQQLSNGGFVIAGSGGCVLKLNPDGTLVWWRYYGGDGHTFFAIREIPDNGMLGVGIASGQGWAVKINSDGTLLWSKSSQQVGFKDIVEVQSDSMIIAGETEIGPGGGWLLKLSGEGEIYNCDLLDDFPISSQDVSVTVHVVDHDDDNTSANPFATPLDNHYVNVNTIDVCPMSATTSDCSD